MRAVVVAALIACAMTALCVAEEDVKADVPREEDQEMQTDDAQRRQAGDYTSKDVKVTALIPDYLGKEIPAGEEVEMLVWFANTNPEPMTINGIFAALQSSMDASRFIQNFTPRVFHDFTVKTNSEVSISYKFRPSEYLTPMPYRFFSLIEYSDAHGQRYFNVLFNETLGFSEANVAFDVELITTYLIILGTFAGGIYGIYHFIMKKAGKGKGKKGAKTDRVSRENTSDEDNEWLKGTNAQVRRKKNN